MILTKKRFEEELSKRMYEREREKYMARRINQLEERIYSLEKEIERITKKPVDFANCEPGE